MNLKIYNTNNRTHHASDFMRNPVGLFLLWRVFMGDDKKLPDEVGGMDTVLPEEAADKMKALLTAYNAKEKKTFEEILDFHVRFEQIHLFQDGNGRVGRLIMCKECLNYDTVPFMIEDDLKMFCYRSDKKV